MGTSHSKIRSPKNKGVESIKVPSDVMAFIKASSKEKENKHGVTQEAINIVTECYKYHLNAHKTKQALIMKKIVIGIDRIFEMRRALKAGKKLIAGIEYKHDYCR